MALSFLLSRDKVSLLQSSYGTRVEVSSLQTHTFFLYQYCAPTLFYYENKRGTIQDTRH